MEPIFLTNNIRRPFFIWVLVAAIFVADLLAPRRFDIAFVYLLALFLAVFFRNKNDVLLLAVITTTLTILGAVLKPREVPLEQALLECLLPVLSLWTAAFFVLRCMALRDREELQNNRFETLFRCATSGILLTNQDGRIVMANPASEALFGYEPGALAGKSIETLVPPRFAGGHVVHREAFYDNPHTRNMGSAGLDLMGLKKDGSEFPIEIGLSPFYTREGMFVVSFLVDNTARKHYENSILQQKQALAALSEALQHANEDLEDKVRVRTQELEQTKNELLVALSQERELGELKSRFITLASHEFRTPLTSVVSSASLVEQYAARGDFENVNKHAGRIKNAANNLNNILTDFFSLEQMEEDRLKTNRMETDLNVLIQEVYTACKTLFKPGQTFEHRHEGVALVFLDGKLLKNILTNLVSNAAKYSPEDGHILAESMVSEKTIRISIRDNGIGIPVAEQKHLFDRFFRASNSADATQGTGLGLFIVQRYVKMMGGQVGFKSLEGSGSIFWVEFAPATT